MRCYYNQLKKKTSLPGTYCYAPQIAYKLTCGLIMGMAAVGRLRGDRPDVVCCSCWASGLKYTIPPLISTPGGWGWGNWGGKQTGVTKRCYNTIYIIYCINISIIADGFEDFWVVLEMTVITVHLSSFHYCTMLGSFNFESFLKPWWKNSIIWSQLTVVGGIWASGLKYVVPPRICTPGSGVPDCKINHMGIYCQYWDLQLLKTHPINDKINGK